MDESQITLLVVGGVCVAVLVFVLGCRRLALLLTMCSYVGTALLILLLLYGQVSGKDIVESLDRLITEVSEVVSPASRIDDGSSGEAQGAEASAGEIRPGRP
jgi:hypothetical protein